MWQHFSVCPSRQYATPSSVDVMAAELKPYPGYKDSGVEWLGKVPTHWEVRHLGRIGRFSKGGGGTKEDATEHGVPCVRYGDLYTHHLFFITTSRTCVSPELAATVYTPIQYGDVLFAGSGETIDEIGKSAVNLIRGPAGIVPFVVELREWRTPCFRTEVVYFTPRQQPHRRAGPARPRRRPGSAGRGSPAPAGSAAPPPPARSPPSVESSGRRATA